MSKNKTSKILAISLTVISLALSAYSIYSYLRIHSLERQVEDLSLVKSVNGPLEMQVVKQQIKLDSLITENEKAYNKLNDLQRYSDSASGVFFEVQLGRYSSFNLNQFRNKLVNLRQEEVDGAKLILLGRFDSKEEAELLLADVKRLGLRNAFVIGRIEGVIVSVEEAEAALK